MNPTTLPDLSAPYPVSPEQSDGFQRHGHILLRGVASADEIAPYRTVILAAREQFGAGRLRSSSATPTAKHSLKE